MIPGLIITAHDHETGFECGNVQAFTCALYWPEDECFWALERTVGTKLANLSFSWAALNLCPREVGINTTIPNHCVPCHSLGLPSRTEPPLHIGVSYLMPWELTSFPPQSHYFSLSRQLGLYASLSQTLSKTQGNLRFFGYCEDWIIFASDEASQVTKP